MIDVADFAASDMTPAIELPRSGRFGLRKGPERRWETLYRYKDQLVAPVHHNGSRLGLRAFGDAIRERDVQVGVTYSHPPFDDLRFPTRGCRHGAGSEAYPLDYVSLGGKRIQLKWPPPEIFGSDFDRREAEAGAFLSDAIVLVDGYVHLQCPEPTWQVVHVSGRNYELILQRAPWPAGAHSLFRLDHLERAYAWAEESRFRMQPLQIERPTIAGGAIEREDILEIAWGALTAWPRLAGWATPPGAHHGPYRDILNALYRFRDGAGAVDWHQVTELTDELEFIMTTYAPQIRWQSERYGSGGAIFEGVRRLRFEQRSVPPGRFAEFSDDDIAAMETLDLGWQQG